MSSRGDPADAAGWGPNRAKEVSSTEVTRACLDQIGRDRRQIPRSFCTSRRTRRWRGRSVRVDPQRLPGAARRCRSPLAGVPLALRTVHHHRHADHLRIEDSRGWTSPYDATVTARLRAAGIPSWARRNGRVRRWASSHRELRVRSEPAIMGRRRVRVDRWRQRGGSRRVPGTAGHRIGHRGSIRQTRRVTVRPGRETEPTARCRGTG